MQLDEKNFESEVKKYTAGPVLVYFFAVWCGPCQMQSPIVEELSADLNASGAKIFKVNIDEAETLAQQLNVLSVPTILIFSNGELKETLNGLQSKEVLKSKLDQYK